MSKSNYQRILEDKPIAYHPDLARIAGSVTAGIFLSQLVYWSPRGSRMDGYIWKTQKDWEEETALSRYEQETARKKLKTSGILLEKLIGIPAKLHYKIDWKILNELLDAHYAQASMRDSRIQECDNPANSNAGIPQSITESTPENTEKNTTDNIYENDGIATDFALEPIVSALELVSKERMIIGRDGNIKNKDKFYDVALTLHSEGATPGLVAGFGEWWETNCWYTPPTKASLTTVVDDWDKYMLSKQKTENAINSDGSYNV